jgi:hypothetical protein
VQFDDPLGNRQAKARAAAARSRDIRTAKISIEDIG